MYPKQTWANGPLGQTPINAERLNNLEEGVEAVHAKLDGEEFMFNRDEVLQGMDEYLRKVVINDDGTTTANWPNRLSFEFAGHLTGWFGEYGELRACCAKDNTVGFRVFGKAAEADNRSATTPIAEVVSSRNVRTPLWGVLIDGTTYSAGPIERRVPNGPTLKTGYLQLAVGAAVPANTPAGTLIVRV